MGCAHQGSLLPSKPCCSYRIHGVPGFVVGTPRPQGDQEELSIGGEETENMGMWMGGLQTYVPSPSKSSWKEG